MEFLSLLYTVLLVAICLQQAVLQLFYEKVE